MNFVDPVCSLACVPAQRAPRRTSVQHIRQMRLAQRLKPWNSRQMVVGGLVLGSQEYINIPVGPCQDLFPLALQGLDCFPRLQGAGSLVVGRLVAGIWVPFWLSLSSSFFAYVWLSTNKQTLYQPLFNLQTAGALFRVSLAKLKMSCWKPCAWGMQVGQFPAPLLGVSGRTSFSLCKKHFQLANS